jgi:hypothetical protein
MPPNRSKVGDLVYVLYETKRYYIVVEALPRKPFGERRYKLLSLRDGSHKVVPYSEIKTVSKAEANQNESR